MYIRMKQDDMIIQNIDIIKSSLILSISEEGVSQTCRQNTSGPLQFTQ
jgi:hypothetical protein